MPKTAPAAIPAIAPTLREPESLELPLGEPAGGVPRLGLLLAVTTVGAAMGKPLPVPVTGAAIGPPLPIPSMGAAMGAVQLAAERDLSPTRAEFCTVLVGAESRAR